MNFRTPTIFLLAVVVFCALFFSDVNIGAAQPSNTQRQNFEHAFDVTVYVFLVSDYGLYDLDIHHEVVVNITAKPSETPINSIFANFSFSLREVNGTLARAGTVQLPSGAYYDYGFWGFPPVASIRVTMPENMSFSSVILKGYLGGSSLLWRSTAEISFVGVSAGLGIYGSYELVLVAPSTSRVLKIYSVAYPSLRYRTDNVDGRKFFIFSQAYARGQIAVLYEPVTWETYAIILTFLIVFLVFAIPFILKSNKLSVVIRKKIALRHLWPGLTTILRRLHDRILALNSSKLLAAYVLCGIIMISLSVGVGPDPRLKVYVLSSTTDNAQKISRFVSGYGAFAITVFDEMNEFETLTNLGVFSGVVVGNFYPGPPDSRLERVVRERIYPALDSVPITTYPSILILEYEGALPSFTSELQRRYPEKVVVVDNENSFITALRDLYHAKRKNVFGLYVGQGTFFGVTSVVAGLSFVLFFLGLAFLSSKLIEAGKKPRAGGFPEAIVYSFFVFVFSQMVYTVCSVLLSMPLGLHTSVSKVTAVGLLGLGGGSRPRMLAGFIGFLFGALISMKAGPKLSKAGLVAIIIVGFFVLVDPLTGGIIFYEFVMLFTVGPWIEYAFTTPSYIRMLFWSVSNAFGAWVSSSYPISTGTMLYFACTVPFCLFSKLERGVGTVLLLFCAFGASAGGIRLAEMIPWKTIASTVPGMMIGFALIGIFCLFNLIETFIWRKINIT